MLWWFACRMLWWSTIKTEPTESEVVVKTEVEDVAQPRLAAKMMLGVLGIKT